MNMSSWSCYKNRVFKFGSAVVYIIAIHYLDKDANFIASHTWTSLTYYSLLTYLSLIKAISNARCAAVGNCYLRKIFWLNLFCFLRLKDKRYFIFVVVLCDIKNMVYGVYMLLCHTYTLHTAVLHIYYLPILC